MFRKALQLVGLNQSEVKEEKAPANNYVPAIVKAAIKGMRKQVTNMVPFGNNGALGCSFSQIIHFEWEPQTRALTSTILFDRQRDKIDLEDFSQIEFDFEAIITVPTQNELILIRETSENNNPALW
jgi:hypothetical protein